ncbi:MAG: phosphonate C-P lyase system protein PhnG [Methylovirgula sp.]
MNMALVPLADQQRWISALAAADAAWLEGRWNALPEKPAYHVLRPIEMGMVQLRGRIGGSGAAFNFGEATITRSAVELETGERGFAYLLGRKPRQAELAAVFHALQQCPDRRAEIERAVIAPAEAARATSAARANAAAQSTRVDFSALVRGNV